MENDLANFQTSSANANLLLNTDKCKTFRITRKRNKIDHTYKLQDSALKTTGPPPPSHGPNKCIWTSSTSAPRPTNPSGIFDDPRSKSRPSLFVGLYILPSFVPTSHTRPKSALHKLLTSLNVQNAFKDVRQNTYWTYLSSVTSAIIIVSQHWIYYLCVTDTST